jgi:tetratricopeptide (TPR) repeat protein
MKASVYRICMLAFLCLLNACAATGVREVTKNQQLPRQAELTKTPFFPQELYQCGPAALATALNAVDIQVTPEQLTPEVYIPSRQGSLQIEMLAAARRHGAIAVTIPPKLEAVLQEVVAGNVVVVMQNLGFSWAPSWHYAVVVGFDLNRELLWLRSGTFKRFEMSLSAFQRTWARSESWAFVALPPGKLPATAMADDVAKALVAFEKHATTSARTNAYQSAVERWPTHLVLLMGLGNSAYKAGDMSASARVFQQAITAHPNAAPAYNNLANVLLAQKQAQQANDIAEKGLAVVGDDEKVRQQLLQTLAEIKDYQKQHTPK